MHSCLPFPIRPHRLFACDTSETSALYVASAAIAPRSIESGGERAGGVVTAQGRGGPFAAAYLRQLLLVSGPYRRAWQRYAFRWRRGDPGEINQAAVAAVLARHLWEIGEADDQQALPRGMKDRVARALRGEVLSPRTLRLFIDAFDISDVEASRLWMLLGAPAVDAPYVMTTYPETGFRTMLLHEFCVVGADGRPREERTIQVIRAVDPGIDRYRVALDADASAIEVVRGGRAGPMTVRDDGQISADIEFGRKLVPGETASFEYRVLFAGGIRRRTAFTRSALRRVNGLELRVQFDPHQLPSAVSWCVWRGTDGPLRAEHAVELDDDYSAHRYLPRLEASKVGFIWRW